MITKTIHETKMRTGKKIRHNPVERNKTSLKEEKIVISPRKQAILEAFSQKISIYAFLSYKTFLLEDYIFLSLLLKWQGSIYFKIYSILKKVINKKLKTAKENKILSCHSVKRSLQ